MNPTPAKLNAFPVFMRVEGRIVLVVGNGEEALAKARLLSQSSARIVVVADAIEPAFLALGRGERRDACQRALRCLFNSRAPSWSSPPPAMRPSTAASSPMRGT